MKRISNSAWDRIILPRWSCSACRIPSRALSAVSNPTFSTSTRSPTSTSRTTRRPFSTTSPRLVSSAIDPATSAKLAALHARLGLLKSFPTSSLARCLIDPSTERDLSKNNDPLCHIGNTLAGFFVSEHLLCTYPRIPVTILTTALEGYCGTKALAAIGREWGVEQAFEPTPEVDPGLLQFRRLEPGQEFRPRGFGNSRSDTRNSSYGYPPYEGSLTTSASSSGNDDISEEEISRRQPQDNYTPAIALEFAMASFVRSTIGGVYVHSGGLPAASNFVSQHILSRKLELSRLFKFDQPTRVLSRLCQREGFEPPVARLLAETGRNSRHPVYVVGVYSGSEKLGEGNGSSLDEARHKAAVNALKGWYLYRPIAGGVEVPSKMVGKGLPGATGSNVGEFRPVLIDVGEVIC